MRYRRRSIDPIVSLSRPYRIAIVATNGPAMMHGLSAYLRGLNRSLHAERPVECVVRFNRTTLLRLSYVQAESSGVEGDQCLRSRIIRPARLSSPLLRLSRRLMFYEPMQPTARRLFAAGYRRALAAAISRDTDIIHVIGTGWEMLGPSVLPIARRRGVPVTVLPAIHPGTWGDSAFDASFYRESDAVFALSRAERARLVELGVSASRVHLCGLAPDTTDQGDAWRFRVAQQLEGRFLVLFIGRKERSKGYPALVEAMVRVRQTIPDACLVAIGGGDSSSGSALGQAGLRDLGVCDEAVKADALAACDVFCMPSGGEAFGIVYVEAWAYGKPVVGGTAPAVRELIRNGVDGFTCEQRPAELAEVLIRLLKDSALRDRLGSAGLERQRRSFTWPEVARRHEEVFTDLLSSRARH